MNEFWEKVNIFDSMAEFFTSVAQFLPNVIGALLILIIGWFIAKIVAGIVGKVLKAVKIDKLGDRLNDIDILKNFKIKPSKVISKFVYYAILLMFVIAASDVLGFAVVSELIKDFISFLPKVLVAVLILGIGFIFADFIRKIVVTAAESLGVPSARMIGTVVFYFLILNVVMVALSTAEIDISFITSNINLIIAGAVLAFALGFGLSSRDLLGNMLGGLYSRNKINVGDTIKVSGEKGTVVAKDNSSITLQTSDRKIIMPMKKLTSEEVEIFS